MLGAFGHSRRAFCEWLRMRPDLSCLELFLLNEQFLIANDLYLLCQVGLEIEAALLLRPSGLLSQGALDKLIHLGLGGFYHSGLNVTEGADFLAAAATAEHVSVVGRISLVNRKGSATLLAVERDLI